MNRYIAASLACCMMIVLAECQAGLVENPLSRSSTCGPGNRLECSADQYCDYGVGRCKEADGICKTKPKICTKEYRPVCGCDGKTYGNACTAAGSGVSIDHPGECAAEKPQACAGIAGLRCPDGMVCVDDPADSCDPQWGGADCSGICKAP